MEQLWACFSSGLHQGACTLIYHHECSPCIVGPIKTHCGTAETLVGSRWVAHNALLVLSCSGSGTHFYWSQNRLRMDYGFTINYGVKTTDDSLT